jgi:hypothetical protein
MRVGVGFFGLAALLPVSRFLAYRAWQRSKIVEYNLMLVTSSHSVQAIKSRDSAPIIQDTSWIASSKPWPAGSTDRQCPRTSPFGDQSDRTAAQSLRAAAAGVGSHGRISEPLGAALTLVYAAQATDRRRGGKNRSAT